MGCKEGGIFEATELALHALGGVHGAELRGGRPLHGGARRAEVKEKNMQCAVLISSL